METHMKTNSILYKTLTRALSIARPHDTTATRYFTGWLEDRVPLRYNDKMWTDSIGNLHIDARTSDTHKTLFVAHVDTVHKVVAINKFRKTKTMWYADGAPLGADDGAGCAILMHMLCAGVPAYYVFTQGEECGGIGSSYLALHYPDLLGEFDRAIAFDRKGVDSVITHQAYGRCCSETFAQQLSDQLNATSDDMMYLPDSTGVYTDTAEFVDIIPECTNVSVGYMYEHGDKEELDIIHFKRLADAVLKVQWDSLPVERDPTLQEESVYATYKGYNYNSCNSTKYGDAPMNDYVLDIRDALYNAEIGQRGEILGYIAESVYPEDPDMALHFLDSNKLTPDVLERAQIMLDAYDPDTVLCTLFDLIRKPN